jgi:hypothetical protein
MEKRNKIIISVVVVVVLLTLYLLLMVLTPSYSMSDGESDVLSYEYSDSRMFCMFLRGSFEESKKDCFVKGDFVCEFHNGYIYWPPPGLSAEGSYFNHEPMLNGVCYRK